VTRAKRKKQQRLSNDEVDAVREAFFSFFVNVFQNYDKYSVTSQGGVMGNVQRTVEGVNAVFNHQKFVDEAGDQKPFLKHFVKLQMFTRLLERKFWPSKNEDIIDVMFFDESIRAKFQKPKKSAKGQ